ncbi:hypothetical protein L3Q82_003415 [Scortum barcoo]|uniref:Uncharacterized protein n=1 Tax=Scortum barcoo TaxID=214431 RepID=A0ACB8VMN7_9TELE|nr:hypothetical protein L3Q82_003415 [Scortum barcoo]
MPKPSSSTPSTNTCSSPTPLPGSCCPDFSSAFNILQPHILAERLYQNFNMNNHLILWILDFLITGSPKGCMLSPLLFILYTDKCRSMLPNCHLVKFADDIVLLSLLSGPSLHHGPALQQFVEWCDTSRLELNVSQRDGGDLLQRPKGTGGDDPRWYKQVQIPGYHSSNTEGILRKCHQRMYLLRKLNSFSVSKNMLLTFYYTLIESVLAFSAAELTELPYQPLVSALNSRLQALHIQLQAFVEQVDSLVKPLAGGRDVKVEGASPLASPCTSRLFCGHDQDGPNTAKEKQPNYKQQSEPEVKGQTGENSKSDSSETQKQEQGEKETDDALTAELIPKEKKSSDFQSQLTKAEELGLKIQQELETKRQAQRNNTLKLTRLQEEHQRALLHRDFQLQSLGLQAQLQQKLWTQERSLLVQESQHLKQALFLICLKLRCFLKQWRLGCKDTEWKDILEDNCIMTLAKQTKLTFLQQHFTPGALPPRSLRNYLSDFFGLGDGVHLRVLSLCFLIGRQVSGIEEILEVFLPPSDNVPNSMRSTVLPTRTVNSAGRVLLPPSEAPDGRFARIFEADQQSSSMASPNSSQFLRLLGPSGLRLAWPAGTCQLRQESHRPTWSDRTPSSA